LSGACPKGGKKSDPASLAGHSHANRNALSDWPTKHVTYLGVLPTLSHSLFPADIGRTTPFPSSPARHDTTDDLREDGKAIRRKNDDTTLDCDEMTDIRRREREEMCGGCVVCRSPVLRGGRGWRHKDTKLQEGGTVYSCLFLALT
jgi:hypothetical protein